MEIHPAEIAEQIPLLSILLPNLQKQGCPLLNETDNGLTPLEEESVSRIQERLLFCRAFIDNGAKPPDDGDPLGVCSTCKQEDKDWFEGFNSLTTTKS